MIGFFLIALVLFFIVAFIAIFKKRKAEDLSEIESADLEDDSIISDSLPLMMASEVIADDDPDPITDAVDPAFAVAPGVEYLPQNIPDTTTDIPENPDSSSGSSYDSESSSSSD